jgi:hypothetical protein
MPAPDPTTSRHVIVTRLSVPRLDEATGGLHRDREWLAGRIELLRRFYIPSVGRLGVPAVVLCSSDSAGYVAERTADVPWLTVKTQDDWYGGWTGGPEQVLTRLDSDDGIHEEWFRAVDEAPGGFEVYVTKRFLRYDPVSRGLYDRKRQEPAPLAAFVGGRNPFAHDHASLEKHYHTLTLPEAYLLQVVHGGNLSWRRPSWRHFPYRVGLERLEPFGVEP